MRIIGKRRRLPPVLLYHAVCRALPPALPEWQGLVVEPERFAWQMADLARRGFRTVTLDEYAAALDGARLPRRSVLLTFDDAYAHLEDVVTPVLTQHGFSAAVFASWQSLGELSSSVSGPSALRGLAVATPEQLLTMAAGPWQVGSHALWHIDLRELSPTALMIGLSEARERFTALVGRPVLDLAYPYGHQDSLVRRAAQMTGYRMAFTVDHGSAQDRFRLPRLQVHGMDGRLVFRLASSPVTYPSLRLAGDVTPAWVKQSMRVPLHAISRVTSA